MSEPYAVEFGERGFVRERCRFEISGGQSRILSAQSTNRTDLRRGEGGKQSFDGQDSFPEFRAGQEGRGRQDVRSDERAGGVEQSDIARLDRLSVMDLLRENTKLKLAGGGFERARRTALSSSAMNRMREVHDMLQGEIERAVRGEAIYISLGKFAGCEIFSGSVSSSLCRSEEAEKDFS